MQLVALGVYGKKGQRRDVKFQTNALNILTGKSKTGKTAILDIAEYCLGRDTVTISQGTISDIASWYYVLVQFSDERVLICRPNPETATTNRAMVRTGGLDLTAPDFAELEVNADTDVVRDTLSGRLGIEAFTVEADASSLRSSFDVSVRQALFFCFQTQGEIASRDILFHRQVKDEIRGTIRETLPYFLGAATPEQAAIRRQLVTARRALQRTLNAMRSMEQDLEQQDARITHIIESATSLDVLPGDAVLAREGVLSLLEEIMAYSTASDLGGGDETSLRRRLLTEERNSLRSRVREIDDQIELLERLGKEQSDELGEAGYQVQRLRALDLLVPAGDLTDGDVSVCPLCDQSLSHRDETIDELRAVLERLELRLQSSTGAAARRDASIERLRGRRAPLIEAIQENLIELDALAQQEGAIADGRERAERIAFLQGRVSQELERGVDVAGDLAELRAAERQQRGRLARLEELADRDNPDALLRSAVDAISDLMTDYARFLQLEGSEHYVRLDPVQLTVAIQRPGGRIPLARMGSAENWVGYHLAAHLALHHWFATNDRPVPRFLMFDQPTQAFFPEEIVDAADDENADWEAVRRQFTLMRDVVAALDGSLQVIVCDHANLADGWFQDAVIDNWRNGVALIPSGWLEE
ncbi:DUF3732 domain-containing protein [Microlunatus elymi]|uniref:DUF3732 domain-containing protein n=1 Tax=Microlunatus elymi TaxID=2596828 RepID=A0A516PVD3_9ACTN|nr:DUF3732 domain-containing protein [Microlunatus elymi]QDP95158.1 DUF3732 domain-containing protein [Microlunatus elymi]